MSNLVSENKSIEISNLTTYVFNGHVKIVKIYMVKFNVSILIRLKIMGFFVNTKKIHKHNVIFNKTITKIVTILAKCFLPYLNPSSLQPDNQQPYPQSRYLKIDAYLVSHDFWHQIVTLFSSYKNYKYRHVLKTQFIQKTICECRGNFYCWVHISANCFEVWIVIWMDATTNIFLWISRFTTILSQCRGGLWNQV